MNLGAEPKKVAILGGLLAVAAITYYLNTSSDAPAPASTPRATAVQPANPVPPPPTAHPKQPERTRANRSVGQDWQPRLGPKNPEDRPDPATIDPTLRLDLLAKVQTVEAGPAGRNLFVFGAAPPPPAVLPHVDPIRMGPKNQATQPVPTGPVQPPPPPPAPPITLKYYGYKITRADGHKAAFLLDGEDILVAGENDTLKHRYKVVKIGVNSITIEDTQFKSTQTLPLTENPAA
jgi:hypothetical protein